ncbi:uncharacterized protein LOC130430118 isoform X1 [Triplophysa dalaica]|uniref:uncharacterized protein LOC130430118 isoform X1 n=1 Tax=Triplophysa dalaica TaxID=1582913 RepID=UPI0024E0319B|nr:uncharacterized protein LOC130430118 isoform X1 [Triplophysa dalaica]
MFMIKRFSMKVIQFQFYLLILSQTAETFTDRLTDLGQNVTINCDLHEEEVYWFFLKLPGPPVMILRTFSSPFYYNERFINKYSVQSKHHLFINNVTHDELGVYYCMNPENKSKEFSNGTRLHINKTISATNSDGKKPTQWLVIMSGLMNGVLLIVVIGLLKVFVCGSRGTRQDSEPSSDDLQPAPVMDLEQDSGQTEYAEVHLPTQPSCPTPFKPIHLNSTYALVQLSQN